MSALSALVKLAVGTSYVLKGLILAYPNIFAIISDTHKKADINILVCGMFAPVVFVIAGVSASVSNRTYMVLGCTAVIMQGYFMEFVDTI